MPDEEPQKLTPLGIGAHRMKGFGMSISGNVDVDRNGMVDLAIGAFDSGSAVVLRSLEVMRLKTSFWIQTFSMKSDSRSQGLTLSDSLIQPSDGSELKHSSRLTKVVGDHSLVAPLCLILPDQIQVG